MDTTDKKHFFSLYDGRNDPEGVDITKYNKPKLSIQIGGKTYKVFAIPLEVVTDKDGNDISEWVFYINDPNEKIYNTLINISNPEVVFKFYTVETQQIPLKEIEMIEKSNNIFKIKTKYAHRLTRGDVIYFDTLDKNNKFVVDTIMDYDTLTIHNNNNNVKLIPHPEMVLFDTYNIKSEYLYFYSKEIYTNNNTYNSTNFFNNNGPTFNIRNIDLYPSLEELVRTAFHNDPVNNKSYLYTKISERRNIYYSFSLSIGDAGEGSTQVDGAGFNDNICNTMLVNTNVECIIENHTDVNHYHHQHVNNYQMCGYRSEAHGFNIKPNRYASNVDENNNYIPDDKWYDIQYDSTFNYITNQPYNPIIQNPQHPESEYRYQNEIFVPFYGYEDTTAIPIALGSNLVTDNNKTGVVEAPYGTRGRIRIRFTNKDFVGKFVQHCHLLDDQDMGMMKAIEIVGIDKTGNYYYPVPNTDRMPNQGIKTDYYNNIWSIQPN